MRSMGEFHESLEMLTAAKTAAERVDGPHHHACTCASYFNLARVLQNLYRFDEAMELLVKVVEMTQNETFPRRFAVLGTMESCLYAQGKFLEAGECSAKLLDMARVHGDMPQKRSTIAGNARRCSTLPTLQSIVLVSPGIWRATSRMQGPSGCVFVPYWALPIAREKK